MELVGASYNVMCPVAEPIRYCGQTERMTRIPRVVMNQLDHVAFLDFLVVQESIVNSHHLVLSEGLRGAGFVHETQQIVGSLSNLKIVQGGLVLFSRHPIVKQANCVFEGQCTREDCLASKGALYAQIRKGGRVFHVFSVHVQSWESPESRAVRRGQFDQFAKFVRAQEIPAEEPVVLMGDFNADLYSEQQQVFGFFDLLESDMLPRHPQTHPYSSDPATNQLMGIDDTKSYSSDAFPGGCSEEYMKHMMCVCCPREWLDYALVHRAHAPISRADSWVRVVPVKVTPFLMNVSVATQRMISDLSDHYPIVARWVFPTVEATEPVVSMPPVSLDAPVKPRRTNKAYKFIMFSIVGTMVVLGVFLGCWVSLRNQRRIQTV